MSRGHLELAANQAAVEIALLQKARAPVEIVHHITRHGQEVFGMLRDCKFNGGTKSWGETIVFPSEEVEEQLVGRVNRRDFGRARSQKSVKAFYGHTGPANQDFKNLSLGDRAIRFTVRVPLCSTAIY